MAFENSVVMIFLCIYAAHLFNVCHGNLLLIVTLVFLFIIFYIGKPSQALHNCLSYLRVDFMKHVTI
jgi:hypothetical protein